MKTNEEIESILSHLIGKLNRIEAMVAEQTKPSGEKIVIGIDTSAVAKSIAVIETALRDIETRRLFTICEANGIVNGIK